MTDSTNSTTDQKPVQTKIITILNKNNLKEELQEAIELIKQNELIAFPTETVYGLGANALNDEAVKKIFKAKGRPSDNPIITHISSQTMFQRVVHESFDYNLAKKLMNTFWPGPLTLILPKADIIPYSTTGNLETIAVRMPSHPIALALIKESNLPIAAPSANLSGKPSPTTAQDVFDDMNGRIKLIVDGGPTDIGLESTVLDISDSSRRPIILRPGKITKEEIENCLDIEIDFYDSISHKGISEDIKPKSPGMKYRHYAPNAELRLVASLESFRENYFQAKDKNKFIGLIISNDFKECLEKNLIDLDKCYSYIYKDDEDLGSKLYFKLREMDKKNVDLIIAYYKDTNGFSKAIMNRLYKASSKK